jgi:hypothetical protein
VAFSSPGEMVGTTVCGLLAIFSATVITDGAVGRLLLTEFCAQAGIVTKIMTVNRLITRSIDNPLLCMH